MANNTVAEGIARNTWNRLNLSRCFGTRLGEETLTDLLVLDLVSQTPSGSIQAFQTTKIQEARQGADLFIYVHRGGTKADIYAIQAKKLHPSGRYNMLGSRSGNKSQLQIDTLEIYAMAKNVIPLYLLYNHGDAAAADQKRWHCCKPIDKEQFGCTLVPSWRIRQAILSYGCRTFDYIHLDKAALPWRCAFDCPNQQWPWEQVRKKAEKSHHSPGYASSEILRNMSFEGGQGVWPTNLWESEISSVHDRESWYKDEILEIFRSDSEVARETGSSPLSDILVLPRWLLLLKPRFEQDP